MNTKQYDQEYLAMFTKFLVHEISDQEWREYCLKKFYQRMEECLPVFQRMKDK